jgi:hypothetical protein
MLDLTHHLIVKFAAYRVGKNVFDNYIILGDDVVIADEAVATSYYSIMTQELFVDINLSKGLISPNGFLEFAKRFKTYQDDYTPVSLREFSS